MDIQVVLTETDPKLGKRGEIVKVSSGFANNFLIPNKKAILATPANLKSFEAEKEREVKSNAQKLAAAQELAQKITKVSLTVEVAAGEGDKLYGAVTNQDIQRALESQGAAVDKKEIHLEEPIRKLGAYQVPLKLHPEVSVTVKLWVVKKKI